MKATPTGPFADRWAADRLTHRYLMHYEASHPPVTGSNPTPQVESPLSMSSTQWAWSQLALGIGHAIFTTCLALLTLTSTVLVDLPASATTLAVAALGQLSALAFAPLINLGRSLMWSALSGSITCVCAAIFCQARTMVEMPETVTLLWLVVGSTLITFVFTTLIALGAQSLPSAIARTVVLATIVAAALTPVWLGPAAEWSANQWVADIAVAISPVTFLAGIVDYDYLRSLWFYEHSAIGSLRFTYPDPVAATAMWLFASSAMAAAHAMRKNSNKEVE